MHWSAVRLLHAHQRKTLNPRPNPISWTPNSLHLAIVEAVTGLQLASMINNNSIQPAALCQVQKPHTKKMSKQGEQMKPGMSANTILRWRNRTKSDMLWYYRSRSVVPCQLCVSIHNPVLHLSRSSMWLLLRITTVQTLFKEVRGQDGRQADRIVISRISFAHPMGSHLQSISWLPAGQPPQSGDAVEQHATMTVTAATISLQMSNQDKVTSAIVSWSTSKTADFQPFCACHVTWIDIYMPQLDENSEAHDWW